MKAYLDTRSGKYLSQKAYDRWLAGRDPQDMPQHEQWTSDLDAAASMHDDETPPIAEGCKIVPVP